MLNFEDQKFKSTFIDKKSDKFSTKNVFRAFLSDFKSFVVALEKTPTSSDFKN